MTPADRVDVCGNGRVDMARASSFNDRHPVLYAEGAVETDPFAVYRIPLPPEFRSGGDHDPGVTGLRSARAATPTFLTTWAPPLTAS